jgi:hypothetical protein
LRAGLVEVGSEGLSGAGAGEKMGLGKLKATWAGKREDRRMERGKMAEWGADAGKIEEGRVLEWLDRKWTKTNDTVNVQIVPDHTALVAGMMPSGREAFGSTTPGSWSPKLLREDVLASMRAPLILDDGPRDEDSSGDEVEGRESSTAPPGAFPGMNEGVAYY